MVMMSILTSTSLLSTLSIHILLTFHLHLPLIPRFTRILGKELYKIIAARVSAYLRGSSSRIRRLAVSMEREGISSGKDRSNSKGGDDDSDHTKSANRSTQLDFSQGDVRPLEVEDAVGRSIPPTGFLLRFVMGGGKSACTCRSVTPCSVIACFTLTI